MTPAHAVWGQADHRPRPWRAAGPSRAATQIHGAPGPRSRLWAPTKPPAAPSEGSPLRAPTPTCIMIPAAPPALRAPRRCITCILGIPPPSGRCTLPHPRALPIPESPPLLDDFSFSRRCTLSPSAIYFIVDRRGSPPPGPSEGSTSHSEPRLPFYDNGPSLREPPPSESKGSSEPGPGSSRTGAHLRDRPSSLGDDDIADPRTLRTAPDILSRARYPGVSGCPGNGRRG